MSLIDLVIDIGNEFIRLRVSLHLAAQQTFVIRRINFHCDQVHLRDCFTQYDTCQITLVLLEQDRLGSLTADQRKILNAEANKISL